MERSPNDVQTHAQNTSLTVVDKSSISDDLYHDTATIYEKSDSSTMINSSEDLIDRSIKGTHDLVDNILEHPENLGTDEVYQTTDQQYTDLVTEAPAPVYDLAALWDKHCEYEFNVRDVDATMSTMVSEPYVNHIPTMTGGVGAKELSRFYEHHFINSNPEDTRMIPISRVVGTDRVVDEMLFCFTHDREIDWMLPGITPTGKPVKIPLVVIAAFRDGKLYHEHIYWDQASVLVQIGLLDSTNLPIAGVETANKLLDKDLPSNTLMKRWVESANKS